MSYVIGIYKNNCYVIFITTWVLGYVNDFRFDPKLEFVNVFTTKESSCRFIISHRFKVSILILLFSGTSGISVVHIARTVDPVVNKTLNVIYVN